MLKIKPQLLKASEKLKRAKIIKLIKRIKRKKQSIKHKNLTKNEVIGKNI